MRTLRPAGLIYRKSTASLETQLSPASAACPRTNGSAPSARPSRLLTAASLAVVAIGGLLPLTPLAADLGFVPPPGRFFLILAAMVAAYLDGVQMVKLWFYRHFIPEP